MISTFFSHLTHRSGLIAGFAALALGSHSATALGPLDPAKLDKLCEQVQRCFNGDNDGAKLSFKYKLFLDGTVRESNHVVRVADPHTCTAHGMTGRTVQVESKGKLDVSSSVTIKSTLAGEGPYQTVTSNCENRMRRFYLQLYKTKGWVFDDDSDARLGEFLRVEYCPKYESAVLKRVVAAVEAIQKDECR